MKVEETLRRERFVSFEAEDKEQTRPDGPVAAAIIAAGVGAFSLGLLTTLAEASAGIKDFLNFYDPVGPLSGKTTLTVGVWLVCWGILHPMLRRSSVKLATALTIGVVFMILGILGTFPPFFEIFAIE